MSPSIIYVLSILKCYGGTRMYGVGVLPRLQLLLLYSDYLYYYYVVSVCGLYMCYLPLVKISADVL